VVSLESFENGPFDLIISFYFPRWCLCNGPNLLAGRGAPFCMKFGTRPNLDDFGDFKSEI